MPITRCRRKPFHNNEKETNELISVVIKASKFYSVFHKGTGDERRMTDTYYKELFNKHRKENCPMTDEEKDATKRGAQLLRDFSHPEIYQLLEKYFPKQ